MRFKKGSKVKLRKISRNDEVEVEPSLSMKIHQKKNNCLSVYNDTRFKKSKRDKPVEKDCSRSQSQRHSFEKVDAFEGKKYMQASFNYGITGYYEPEKQKRKTCESDNDQCSVGSCSVLSDGYNKLSSHPDSLSSDGESMNTSLVEHEVAVSVHRLELHAYRSTLEALYASGPLSWEKEAVLTNLRINLHISNDEHLTELKHLMSYGAPIFD